MTTMSRNSGRDRRPPPVSAGEASTGLRVGRVAGTVLKETGLVTLGLGAYASDLIGSLRATPDALRMLGRWTARGYRVLSDRGHRVIGAPAPGTLRPPAPSPEARDAVEAAASAARAAAAEPRPGPAERHHADYEGMTLTELRQQARRHRIAGRSGMNRDELLGALEQEREQDA